MMIFIFLLIYFLIGVFWENKGGALPHDRAPFKDLIFLGLNIQFYF